MLSKYFKNLISFFNQKYWLFLILIVIVSYCQILWMQPWEDDNALFVKLAHINDRVGYFGTGPLGEGVYKYAAVPFIPIYHFLGYNTYAYFSLLLLLYILTTIVVYKVLSYILGSTAGKISGFLFAAGYITSDSFWRMANSATTSISIILINLFIYFYYKYYKLKKNKYYFLSFLLFFLAVQYSVVRDHYLFAIAFAFELIFLAFQKPLRSIFFSIIRLVPFAFVFYYLVVAVGDSRTGGVTDFVMGIFSGKFYLTYGFLSSITNLIIPDYITKFIFKFDYGYLFVLTTFIASIYFLLRNNKNRKLLMSIFYLLSFFWIYIAKHIFTVGVLNIGIRDVHIVTIGGLTLIFSLFLLFVIKKYKSLYVLFMFWLFVNTAAYSSYFPTVAYETINRYLAHSFFALTAAFGILYTEINKKNRWGRLFRSLIIIYGVLNISSAVIYQHGVLLNRSIPVKNFYIDLKTYLPTIEKGDILYFDVSKNAGGYYRDAISAAMIPDTGSFGWRYNIDRYDFSLVSDFKELTKIVTENRDNIYKIHSFWYSKDGLVETTDEIKKYFTEPSRTGITKNIVSDSITITNPTREGTNWVQPDLDIVLPENIESASPRSVELTIKASPLNANDLNFPLYWGNTVIQTNSIWRDTDKINMAMEYKAYIISFLKYSKFKVNSEWQNNISLGAHDDDINTVWQSDRVLWQDRNDYIQVELPTIQNISRVLWIAGNYNNSVPTNYNIEISLDGTKWTTLDKIINSYTVSGQKYNVISFNNVDARFIKMTIIDTFGGDSPMVAEFRIIPSKFSDLNIKNVTDYIQSPALYISDLKTYNDGLKLYKTTSIVNLYWFSNKENTWISSKSTEFEIIFDDKPRIYKFILPAGGTQISKLKISDVKFPGNIKLLNVKIY